MTNAVGLLAVFSPPLPRIKNRHTHKKDRNMMPLHTFCLITVALFCAGVSAGLDLPSAHLPCRPMSEYLPTSARDSYNISKHNGTWYEVSFRDLYPWGPVCDCQQSIKYVNAKQGYIDDYFVFTCGLPINHMNYISPQRENRTNASSGMRHDNGIFDMYVRNSAFKFITHYEWNTEFIGFKDDGENQYKWIIEFQCGTRPKLPTAECLGKLDSTGNCVFTGVQMYVRDLSFLEEGRAEMIQYLRGLGPTTSKSLGVAWVMDDFSGGTFPRWFKNVTWRQDCPLPCQHGVFNQTTGMWGCPTAKEGLQIANPLAPGGVRV